MYLTDLSDLWFGGFFWFGIFFFNGKCHSEDL